MHIACSYPSGSVSISVTLPNTFIASANLVTRFNTRCVLLGHSDCHNDNQTETFFNDVLIFDNLGAKTSNSQLIHNSQSCSPT